MPALADLPTRETGTVARTAGLDPRHVYVPCERPASRPEPTEGSAPVQPRSWITLPEAAAILADCVANPPATSMVEVTDLTTYHARRYVGARVRKLGAIHRAEADRLLAACDGTRDYRAFDAHCRLDVQQAIADALFHAALARSAACDARALERVR